MTFRDRLRAAHIKAGISQARAAAEAGLSERHFKRLLSGASIPTIDTITSIARALGCDRAWLAWGDNGRRAVA